MAENNKIICPNCKNELPQDSGFCQYCGSKIEAPIVDNNSSQVEIKEEPLTDKVITPVVENETAAKILASGIIEGQKAMEANRERQPHNELDADFGLVPHKPVYTVGIDEQEKYLKSLRTINGEPIKWNRRGSMSVNGIHGLIDVYDIYLQSGAEYKTIYINMYGAKNSTIAPKGLVLMAPAIKETAVKVPKQKEPKVCKPKKPVNKKLVLCLTVIPIAVVIVALLAVFVLIPGLKYNHAKSLLENGNYELAYSEFFALDGYFDSENMLLECRYVQAIKYRDAGDYELANKIFESLGNYRDSKILIHKHDYRVVSRNEATCTVAGSEIFECSGCKDSYKNYLNASHTYVNTSTVNATCTSAGNKSFECSVCHNTYSETIAIKAHDYSAATCTSPKTCTSCGKTDGQKLGHSNDLVCTRCGVTTFEKLVLSGTGDKYYTNFNLPAGTYNITITKSSSTYTLWLEDNGKTIVSTSAKTYVKQVKINAMNNSILGVDTADSESWTITIEAVGN